MMASKKEVRMSVAKGHERRGSEAVAAVGMEKSGAITP